MLVVLAIVALLLTIAVPRYFGSLARSRDVALEENLKVLRVTIDKYHADKGRYPETLAELARIDGPALLSLAVRFGTTRLIDNVLLG